MKIEVKVWDSTAFCYRHITGIWDSIELMLKELSQDFSIVSFKIM